MILGQHTLGEVRDLLAAKDYEHGQMQLAADAAKGAIAAADPSWFADWRAFLDRYNAARVQAKIVLSLGPQTGVRAEVQPAEGLWKQILLTLTKDPSKPFTDTDEQGLFNRLQKAGGKPDVSKVPQPATADVDLGIFKTADDLTKQVDKVLPPSPAKNPWPWVLGGFGLLGVGYVAYRASPAGIIARAAFKRR